MKIITLEEHFQLARIKKAVSKMLPGFANGFHLPSFDAPDSELEDLGQIACAIWTPWASMSKVLSYPSSGIQMIPAAEAVLLARDANDQLVTAVQAHPDRFTGLATLPTPDPKAAAAERRIDRRADQ